jgi:hypothetical protein
VFPETLRTTFKLMILNPNTLEIKHDEDTGRKKTRSPIPLKNTDSTTTIQTSASSV